MTEEIKLSKFNDEPWGFRLTGGKDFGTVLTVIKITQGSLAEKAGMQVGDLLLAINDQPLTNLTHSEAHDIIIRSGNNFVFTIVRGSLVSPPPLLKKEILSIDNTDENNKQLHKSKEMLEGSGKGLENMEDEELKTIACACPDLQINLSVPSSPVPVIQVTPPPQYEIQKPLFVKAEEKIDEEMNLVTDEKLQDMMLGHAEVVCGNAVGVDFFKMAPKCEVIERSDVLRAIKEEEVKKARKTLSKFLQQPERPKVTPKQANTSVKTPYKPCIIIPKRDQPEENKQNEESSGEPSGEEKQERETIQEKQKELENQGEQTRPQDQNEHQEQNELEEQKVQENQEEQSEQQANWESDLLEDQDILQEMAAINAAMSDSIAQLDNESSPARSPEFDQQLKKINEQLVNLLCMPLDMQRHLVHVKKQVEELRRLKNPPPPEPEPEPQPEPEPTFESQPVATEQENPSKTPSPTGDNDDLSGKESPQNDQQKPEIEQEKAETGTEVDNAQTSEPEQPEEPILIGPPLHPRRDIQWKKEPAPKNRPFFPLTPKPRPVILPQDVPVVHDNELFSEEFIAETLSGNAEVIQGGAIGVNFLKFKKNYDHLQASDVYQMIHNQEKSSEVFPTRSGKIPSKEDYIENTSTESK